jgi:hypothetical protein
VRLARHGLVLALAWAACGAAAGPASDASRLRARLAPDVAERVIEVVRGATADGLPTASLVARALEGASRHAPGGDIVAAVQRQAGGLAAARRVLGQGARTAELEAGAGALLAGIAEDSLARLRGARPRGTLVIALVVMSDLVARGVPVAAASNSVLAAARAGAADQDLLRMRERVHSLIQRGERPSGASREGLRELLLRGISGNRTDRSGLGTQEPRRSP